MTNSNVNDKQFYLNLGHFLRDRRLELDLSLDAVGFAAGVDMLTVRRWEKGHCRPTIDKFFNVCRELEIETINLAEIENYSDL